jgi:hypothetical protein
MNGDPTCFPPVTAILTFVAPDQTFWSHHTTASQNSQKPNAGQGKQNSLTPCPASTSDLSLPIKHLSWQPYHISSVTPRTSKSGLNERVVHRRSLLQSLKPKRRAKLPPPIASR